MDTVNGLFKYMEDTELRDGVVCMTEYRMILTLGKNFLDINTELHRYLLRSCSIKGSGRKYNGKQKLS